MVIMITRRTLKMVILLRLTVATTTATTGELAGACDRELYACCSDVASFTLTGFWVNILLPDNTHTCIIIITPKWTESPWQKHETPAALTASHTLGGVRGCWGGGGGGGGRCGWGEGWNHIKPNQQLYPPH